MGVTIKQIAQEVGLSWPAVSKILNGRGRFAEETKKRVFAAAAKHDYRPSSLARSLRQQSSRTIGVVFRNDAANALTAVDAFEYLLGINQQLQNADYGTLVIRASAFDAAGDLPPRIFRERLVDGVVAVGAMPDSLVERVRALARHVVWLDAPVWEATCCIRRDEFAAGYECVATLADLGYQRVRFIARGDTRRSHHSHQSRDAGARAAAAARGVAIEVINWPEERFAEEQVAIATLDRRDVGIVISSLPIARRVVHGLGAIGRLPGYDFGVVCCDDSYSTQVGWREMGRAAFDRHRLGGLAGEMILNLLSKPDEPPASIVHPNAWSAGCSAWGPAASRSAARQLAESRDLRPDA